VCAVGSGTGAEIPILEKKELKSYESWEDYNLKGSLLQGIYEIGFNTPSPIQKVAVMPIIERKDIRAQAQSGTGKTGAFSVGSLQLVDETRNVTQALVIVSTREIALQNAGIIRNLGKKMNISVSCLVGGGQVRQDIEVLAKGPQIVVGTPGRVIHMITGGYLSTEHIDLFVVDEADEMLKLGFVEQVREIFKSLKTESVQTAMFSATWSPKELEISKNLLRDNAVIIDLRQNEQTLKGIEQYYINLGPRPDPRQEDDYKVQFLGEIFSCGTVGQSVIFVNTKSRASRLHERLMALNVPCDVIHSSLEQAQRTQVLDKFRNGECRTLIATGVIGRGVDIRQLALVFNYELPKNEDMSTYIHRIGRAGRYGRKGKAINIIFDDETPDIKALEQYYSTAILPLPQNLDYR